MKKILVFICCLMMVVCFAACGETQEAATENNTILVDENTELIQLDQEIISYIESAKNDLASTPSAMDEVGFGTWDAFNIAYDHFCATSDNMHIIDSYSDAYAEDNWTYYYTTAAHSVLFNYYRQFAYLMAKSCEMQYGSIDNMPNEYNDTKETLKNTLIIGDVSEVILMTDTNCISSRESFLKYNCNLSGNTLADYLEQHIYPAYGD